MLSDSVFQNGVPCGLSEDVPEVLSRLKEEDYDYDSNSDLESLPDTDREDKPSPAGQLVTNVQSSVDNASEFDSENPPLPRFVRVHDP